MLFVKNLISKIVLISYLSIITACNPFYHNTKTFSSSHNFKNQKSYKSSNFQEIIATVLANQPSIDKIASNKKLFFFSGPPGGGKGTIFRRSFVHNKDFINKTNRLVLFHSRTPRVASNLSEKDGVAYHFRKSGKLKALAKEKKILVGLVNKQLQGLALKDFIDEVWINEVSNTSELKISDTIIEYNVSKNTQTLVVERNGKNIPLNEIKIPTYLKDSFISGDKILRIEGDRILVQRLISGLISVFKRKEPTILEGGLVWYQLLKRKFPDLNALIIVPFTEEEMSTRLEFTKWVNRHYSNSYDRYLAFHHAHSLNNKERSFFDNLTDENLEKVISEVKLSKTKQFNKKEEILKDNAAVSESDKFKRSIQEHMIKFNFPKMTEDELILARHLSYEIQRRISQRDNLQKLFEKGKNTERLNRLVEGVIQISTRKIFGKDNIIVNPTAYSKEEEKKVIDHVSQKFIATFYKNLLQVTI